MLLQGACLWTCPLESDINYQPHGQKSQLIYLGYESRPTAHACDQGKQSKIYKQKHQMLTLHTTKKMGWQHHRDILYRAPCSGRPALVLTDII